MSEADFVQQYPWVFLNDEDFTEDFKKGVRSMTRSEIHFGKIPKEHWSYPDWVDQEKAKLERQRMQDDRVIYGGSESYRCVRIAAVIEIGLTAILCEQTYVSLQLRVDYTVEDHLSC